MTASKSSLCQNNCSRGWLTRTEVVYPSSRPSPCLTVPSRFRLRGFLAYPRLGSAVEAGSCQLGSALGEVIRASEAPGVRLDPGRKRSGAFIARVIVVPPCDSPENPGGIPCTMASSSLLSSGVSRRLLAGYLCKVPPSPRPLAPKKTERISASC
jgi:hypothetical protein